VTDSLFGIGFEPSRVEVRSACGTSQGRRQIASYDCSLSRRGRR